MEMLSTRARAMFVIRSDDIVSSSPDRLGDASYPDKDTRFGVSPRESTVEIHFPGIINDRRIDEQMRGAQW